MRAAAALVVLFISAACTSSTTAPTAPANLTGLWIGTASDAGVVQWSLTQSGADVSGTMTLLGSNGEPVVRGTVNGTVSASTMAFRQIIGFFQFPDTSMYWQMGFDTRGALTVQGDTMFGNYTSLVQQLRSPPGPPPPGAPFANGVLTLSRK